METERMPVCGSRVCTGHNLHYRTKRLRWDLRLFVHNSVLRTVQVQQMIGTCLLVLEKCQLGRCSPASVLYEAGTSQ